LEHVTDEVRLAIDAWIEQAKADPALQQRAQAAREDIEREASTKREAIAAIFEAGPVPPKASLSRAAAG
jgi:hypothetical protein